MSPAPKKPTPDGIAADTREASHDYFVHIMLSLKLMSAFPFRVLFATRY